MSATPDGEAGAAAVFDALADPTRRSVLRAVAEQGPLTATEVAAALPVSRQAVAKHLGVLREAGLVSATQRGRERRFSVLVQPLVDTQRWLASTGAAWDQRLTRLEALADRSTTGDAPREGPRGRR